MAVACPASCWRRCPAFAGRSTPIASGPAMRSTPSRSMRCPISACWWRPGRRRRLQRRHPNRDAAGLIPGDDRCPRRRRDRRLPVPHTATVWAVVLDMLPFLGLHAARSLAHASPRFFAWPPRAAALGLVAFIAVMLGGGALVHAGCCRPAPITCCRSSSSLSSRWSCRSVARWPRPRYLASAFVFAAAFASRGSTARSAARFHGHALSVASVCGAARLRPDPRRHPLRAAEAVAGKLTSDGRRINGYLERNRRDGR